MQKKKPYIISAFIIFIIIILFPPVKEGNRNDGYSFMFSLDINQSIDATRIFFQILLSIFIISLFYLLRGEFPNIKEYFLSRAELLKKFKLYMIILVCVLLIAIIWWNQAEKIADLFFYSKKDFQSYLQSMNLKQRDYLEQTVIGKEERSILMLPYFIAKNIIEKYLVDTKYTNDLRLSFYLTPGAENIEYHFPEGKTVEAESIYKIMNEANEERLSLHKAIKEYNENRIESEKFVSKVGMTKISGLVLLLSIYSFIIVINHNKRKI
jgi:hypothetical protein